MARDSKYAVQVVQNETSWTANITRRASRKAVVVSKTQDGFATEAEAMAWGEEALKAFVENQSKRNERENKAR